MLNVILVSVCRRLFEENGVSSVCAIAHPAPPVPGALLIFEITQRFEEPVSKTTLKG